ncbi:copper-binding protein [Luteibacter sp. 3190]|uniref:copper-binding protein n=1 Tax=Luteibacter sp. 3190 TaxID=2817736 RepID=UPI00286B06C7|nr:copper-binding protein [Luteibacter sp. 3190]
MRGGAGIMPALLANLAGGRFLGQSQSISARLLSRIIRSSLCSPLGHAIVCGQASECQGDGDQGEPRHLCIKGVIKAIDPAKGTITLQHEAFATLGWPVMTMPFKVASPAILNTVKVGDRVNFGLRAAGMNGTVTSLQQAQP